MGSAREAPLEELHSELCPELLGGSSHSVQNQAQGKVGPLCPEIDSLDWPQGR